MKDTGTGRIVTRHDWAGTRNGWRPGDEWKADEVNFWRWDESETDDGVRSGTKCNSGRPRSRRVDPERPSRTQTSVNHSSRHPVQKRLGNSSLTKVLELETVNRDIRL